ncbi:MAG: PhoD-like phosphatase N-terminal domain-containing protein [Giesbergeria sp.]
MTANPLLLAAAEGAMHQATGTRVGEVTDTSAIVWTRLTKNAQRNNEGIVFAGKGNRKKDPAVTVPVEQIEGACPGMAGSVQLRYGLKEDLSDATLTPWVEVTEATDFIHHFELSGLKPGATYFYASQTRAADGTEHPEFRGKFCTAPEPHSPSQFNFCVMTCQGYQDRDHKDGHPIYPSMQALDPKFIVMTGDLVYYDSNAPRAATSRR